MTNHKFFQKSMPVFIIILLISGLSLVACTTDGDEPQGEGAQDNLELTQEEQNMLLQMREEEKLARDVYNYLYSVYGRPVFDNISTSEQIHMGKVLQLLNTYNIPDPALSAPGEFSDSDLQNLYNDLTSLGDNSLLDALIVGATVEDLDIYDLEDFVNQTDKQDIIDVFNNLTCGSRNHMRAFYSQLTNEGGTYTPQFITQAQFDEIVNSSHEQCNGGN